MPRFSESSINKLTTCDIRIQKVFTRVIDFFDCKITKGHRDQDRQDQLFLAGKSKIRHGKHNRLPSLAVDVAPYPIDYNDRERITYFAGQVVATARMMGIGLRWGGDWNKDTEVKDNGFDDLVHFELKD